MSAATLELAYAVEDDKLDPNPAGERPLTWHRLTAATADAVGEAYEVLGSAEQGITDWRDGESAKRSLDQACERLAARLSGGRVRPIHISRCAEVLVQMHQLRLDFEKLGTHAALDRQATVRQALGRLRGVGTVDQLMDLIPVELCRCGFRRAWLGRVDESQWQLTSFHTEAKLRRSPLAPAGPTHDPRLLEHSSHEAEMVRRRGAVLVADAAGDPRVDPAIAETLAPSSYVAAALLVGTRVVGSVHADHDGARQTSEADRQTIALFAEAVGHVLQRVVLAERLEGLRHEMRRFTASIVDTVDDRCWAAVSLGNTDATPSNACGGERAIQKPTAPAAGHSRLESLVSARELEVLRLLATGETNASIAAQLVISEGTVSSHVKSILRKLHAANRTQAVSRYLRMVNSGNRAG